MRSTSNFLFVLALFSSVAYSAPQYTWESQGTSYTGQIDLGSNSTDPLSGSLTPSYGAINAQNAVQPPVVVISSATSGGSTTSSCNISDNRLVYTSDGSFTVPSGVTKVYISGIGGGGGGAIFAGSSGGGGSGYPAVRVPISVTPSSVIPVVIGLGGSGGVVPPENGLNGGNTSFGTFVLRGGGGAASNSCGIGGANGGGYASVCGKGGYGGADSIMGGTGVQARGGGSILGGQAGGYWDYGGTSYYYRIYATPPAFNGMHSDAGIYPGNGGTPSNYQYVGQGGAGGIHISGVESPQGSMTAPSGTGFGAGGGGQYGYGGAPPAGNGHQGVLVVEWCNP